MPGGAMTTSDNARRLLLISNSTLHGSGYLDHGYYCYTPLFFKDIAAANSYETLDLFVTPAGESRIDQLGIKARSSASILQCIDHLNENNRVPALNIHAILRKTRSAPFRASLEIATAHAPVDQSMMDRYGTGRSPGSAMMQQRRLLDDATRKLDELQRSKSWRLMAPLRYIRILIS